MKASNTGASMNPNRQSRRPWSKSARVILILLPMLLLGATPAVSLQSELHDYAAASGVDLDGDGVLDLLVGAPGYDLMGAEKKVAVGRAVLISGKTGETLLVLEGENAGDHFGASVALAGDFDEDGRGDLLVGAPGANDTGRVYAYSSSDGKLLFTQAGRQSGDRFGSSLAADLGSESWLACARGGYTLLFSGRDLVRVPTAPDGSIDFGSEATFVGDINEDGHTDYAVGAPWRRTASVFSGHDHSLIHELKGSAEDERFGRSICAVSDMDSDSVGDLAVSACPDDEYGYGEGSITFFSGKSGKQLSSIRESHGVGQPAYGFGGAIDCLDDVDGDGINDLAVGMYNWLYPSSQIVSAKAGKVLVPYVRGGGCVSACGDVDGDGYADFVSGPSGRPAREWLWGALTVSSGKTGALLYTIDIYEETTVRGVEAAGDVNDDGYDDVLVALPRMSSSRGEIRGISGQDGSTLFSIRGNRAGEEVGQMLALAGDVNGDGAADILTATSSARGLEDSRILVFCGKSQEMLHEFKRGEGRLGWWRDLAACGAGDVNQDGYDDVLVGNAVDYRQEGTGKGVVYSGKDGTPLFELPGRKGNQSFGRFVARVGDNDHDGVRDLLVGTFSPVKYAQVFSGANGKRIFTLFPVDSSPVSRFPTSICSVGDIDEDGFSDTLIAGTVGNARERENLRAWIFSGRDGDQIETLVGRGISVEAIGDLNGDGTEELAFMRVSSGSFVDVYSGIRPIRSKIISCKSLLDYPKMYQDDHSWPPERYKVQPQVSAAGDVNADGNPDFIVGIADLRGEFGVQVFSGKDWSFLLRVPW